MDPNVAGKFTNNINPNILGVPQSYPSTQEDGMGALSPTGGEPTNKVDKLEKIPIWNQITSGLKVAGKVLGTVVLVALALVTLPITLLGVVAITIAGSVAKAKGADVDTTTKQQEQAFLLIAAPLVEALSLAFGVNLFLDKPC